MKPGIGLAVELTSQKDLDFIAKHLRNFYGVQKVRVNGPMEIGRVSALLEKFDDLEEVQLLQFGGELADQDLERLSWVDNITLYLMNGREDKILFNEYLGKISALTLIFEVVPGNYEFMENWQKLRSLTLVAPYMQKEAQVAVQACLNLVNLNSFGISLDRVTDLPAAVAGMPELKKLTIIDNLSWLSERFIDNLPVLHTNLEIAEGENVRYLDLYYKALDAELMPFEKDHLASIFPNSRFAPLMNEMGDSSELSAFADFVPLQHTEFENASFLSDADKFLSESRWNEFHFEGSNEEDRVYYLPGDVVLMVPRNAMSGTNDSQWHGKYSLHIKMLKDPAGFFVNPVNLNFDSAGRNYELSPAFVFDIAADHALEPLQVRDGYFLRLDFLSRTDSALRFYAWENRKKKWENFYDYDYIFDDTKIQPLDFYNFYAGKKTAREIYAADHTSPERRFERMGYFQMLEPGQNKLFLEKYAGYFVMPVEKKTDDSKTYTLRRGRNLVGIKKEYVNKDEEPGVIKFRIFDKSKMLFPELKAFSNYVFAVEKNLSSREFSNHFIRGAVYSDVRILQEAGRYYLELKTQEGYWKMELRTGDNKKGNRSQKNFNKKFVKYQKTRNARLAAMVRWMSETELKNIGQERVKVLVNPSQNKGKVAGNIRIRSTGVFSWAMPVDVTDTFGLILKPTDAGGIPLNVKRLVVAHNWPFSYRTFGPADNFNMDVDPGRLQYIAVLDAKNRVYYFNREMFKLKKVQANSLVYLPMQELSRPIGGAAELEKILGLNLKR